MDWSPFLQTLLGGVLAIGGGVGAPAVTHWLNRKEVARRERQQHFNELIDAMHDNDHWLTEVRERCVGGAPNQIRLEPTSRIRAIVWLHFDQLIDAIDEYVEQHDTMKIFYSQEQLKRLEGRLNPDIVQFTKLNRAYRKAFDDALGVAMAIGKKEFGTKQPKGETSRAI